MTHTFTVCFYFSLLPFIAKTLERVVFNQFSLFLSQNNKLDAKQSGFRSGHSTETALLCHWSYLCLFALATSCSISSSSRHWCLQIEQLQAQHPPTSTHYYEFTSPPEVWDLLVSDASWYHHREAQNHSPEHSRSPFLAGGMIFPPFTLNAGSLSIFKQQLKTHLFRHYLTSS